MTGLFRTIYHLHLSGQEVSCAYAKRHPDYTVSRRLWRWQKGFKPPQENARRATNFAYLAAGALCLLAAAGISGYLVREGGQRGTGHTKQADHQVTHAEQSV